MFRFVCFRNMLDRLESIIFVWSNQMQCFEWACNLVNGSTLTSWPALEARCGSIRYSKLNTENALWAISLSIDRAESTLIYLFSFHFHNTKIPDRRRKVQTVKCLTGINFWVCNR